MSLLIDDDAKKWLYADLRLTVDPTGSSVELEIGPTRYPMTWLAAAVEVEVGKQWTRTARTNVKFIGSSTTVVGDDVKLAAGNYPAQILVTTSDGQVIDGTTTSIQVR